MSGQDVTAQVASVNGYDFLPGADQVARFRMQAKLRSNGTKIPICAVHAARFANHQGDPAFATLSINGGFC